MRNSLRIFPSNFHFGAVASFSKGVIMFAKLRTTFPIINWLEDLGSYFQSCFVIAAKKLRTRRWWWRTYRSALLFDIIIKRNTTFCLVNRPCQFCKRGSSRKSSKGARTKFSWAIYSPTGRRSQVKQLLLPETDLSNKTTGTKVCKWDKLRGQKKWEKDTRK